MYEYLFILLIGYYFIQLLDESAPELKFFAQFFCKNSPLNTKGCIAPS